MQKRKKCATIKVQKDKEVQSNETLSLDCIQRSVRVCLKCVSEFKKIFVYDQKESVEREVGQMKLDTKNEQK